MLYIEKQPCPPDIKKKLDSITSNKGFRQLPEENAGKSTNKSLRDYFNKIDKRRVRKALLEEQGYLCAYCMARIANDGKVTTIEHFLPLSKFKSRALDYSNYMAVCNGGRNAQPSQGKRKIQCCDASKGNIVTELNPHIKEMPEGLIYTSDGKMHTDYGDQDKNQRIQKEIDEVFVLNGKKLDGHWCDTSTYVVKSRKDAYRILDEVLMEEMNNGSLTVEELDAQISALEDPNVQKKQPFMGVDLYLLRRYKELLSE